MTKCYFLTRKGVRLRAGRAHEQHSQANRLRRHAHGYMFLLTTDKTLQNFKLKERGVALHHLATLEKTDNVQRSLASVEAGSVFSCRSAFPLAAFDP